MAGILPRQTKKWQPTGYRCEDNFSGATCGIISKRFDPFDGSLCFFLVSPILSPRHFHADTLIFFFVPFSLLPLLLSKAEGFGERN